MFFFRITYWTIISLFLYHRNFIATENTIGASTKLLTTPRHYRDKTEKRSKSQHCLHSLFYPNT